MLEDARAVVKPPERGREALGAVPVGADEQRDGVGAGVGPPASGPSARAGGSLLPTPGSLLQPGLRAWAGAGAPAAVFVSAPTRLLFSNENVT